MATVEKRKLWMSLKFQMSTFFLMNVAGCTVTVELVGSKNLYAFGKRL